MFTGEVEVGQVKNSATRDHIFLVTCKQSQDDVDVDVEFEE